MTLFKRNLIIGYGIALLLLVAGTITSIMSINGLLDSSRWINHTNEVVKKLENIISSLKDAETGQRGFLLTGNEVFLDPYKNAQDSAKRLITDVQQLTSDNPEQVPDGRTLKDISLRRLGYLDQMIQMKRASTPVPEAMLLQGKAYMDTARILVRRMQDREEVLLLKRTDRLKQFATSTPVFIIITSVLAVLVTGILFSRVLKDFQRTRELQFALQKKDEEISKRLAAVEDIAIQISAGNFEIQVNDEGKDALGSIAGSLNKMASSLDRSFRQLKDKEWLQAGIAQLNEIMIAEKEPVQFANQVIEFITSYTNSLTGAFYIVSAENSIRLEGGIGVHKSRMQQQYAYGEGIAGQAIKSNKQVLLNDLKATDLSVEYSGGVIKPVSIVAVPIYYEKQAKAVFEVGSLNNFSPVVLDFFHNAVFNIGMALNGVEDYARLQQLLEETQSQSEELQAQHSELENINSELEAQAHKLQASEEELRVQQEELKQANQELEERSSLLEEKNVLILERNLEIQQKSEDLEASTKYKTEFLANMSHELRTPLNSILLLSRLLSENHGNNLNADQVEYAGVIQSSGKGLLTLIDEILDLSKIEAGKMDLTIESIPVSELTDELQALFLPIAADKGIRFDIDLNELISDNIETDKIRINQILKNLISNALKFTTKGYVKLDVRKQGTDICFAVSDTGIGIAKEKQETIFEAFQQADGSTSRQYGGTGLGLSISRELVRLLHGKITLESEKGKGSTFTLILPHRFNQSLDYTAETRNTSPSPVDKTPELKSDRPTGNAFLSDKIPSPIPDDREAIHPGDKIILIIEDDTAFAKSMLEFTRARGYKGIVAVRGDEGIELASRFSPTGILLDIQLPVVNGWDVMDKLKSTSATRHIPVHIMSSHEVKTKSLSKGAVDFVSKPVAYEKLTEIFSRIEDALRRHPKKVLIVEENPQHAKALAYFLGSYSVSSEIKESVTDGIAALNSNDVDCVILDMGIPAQQAYDTLDEVKKTPGLEDLPIIIFTGKNLSASEQFKIRQYADTIVLKTAHSYERILDEVSLFLHLVDQNRSDTREIRTKRLHDLTEVLKGKTILIADDDVRNIFSLTKALESYGINVISAVDGKEALKQLEANPKTDLILMDMMMPELDGYETTKKIRTIPKHRNLPVIAVTAKAMTGDREKCIAAGASDYITKPVDADQLISLLRVWLYQGKSI